MTEQERSPADDDAKPKGLQIGRLLLAGLISALFTVGAGYGTYRVNTRDPKLNYTTTAGPQLSSPSIARRIYVVQVANAGRKEVEELFASVSVPHGRLEDVAIALPTGMTAKPLADSTTYQLTAPYLNPEDTVTISFLVASPDSLPPTIVVRGRGITGKLRNTDHGSTDKSIFFALLLGSVAGLTLFSTILATVSRRSRLGGLLPILDKEDRHVILAYILGRGGFTDLSQQIRRHGRDMMYREIADDLAMVARTDAAKSERVQTTLSALLLIPWMATASREIVLYHLTLLNAPERLTAVRVLPRTVSAVGIRKAVDAHFA